MKEDCHHQIFALIIYCLLLKMAFEYLFWWLNLHTTKFADSFQIFASQNFLQRIPSFDLNLLVFVSIFDFIIRFQFSAETDVLFPVDRVNLSLQRGI